MVVWLHDALIAAHILVGTVGLVAFWVPVAGRKGGATHRAWGKVFWASMIAVGCLAVGIAATTLLEPMATHVGFGLPEPVVVGIFGWMMLYLAVLTVTLAVYGRECIRNRRDHARHRRPSMLALHALLLVLSANCAWQGWRIGQPLMLGISTIGFATVATDLRFMLAARPGPDAWLREHLKGLVGAGISVYTAFLAFGAVRLMPELALSPVLWAIPLVTGLGIIFWHWWDIWRKRQARRVAAA